MPELQVRDAGFSYGREAYRMEHWTQSFVPGAVTAMVGPSGCGKSTRMYLLGLLLKLNSARFGGESNAWTHYRTT